MTPARRLLAFAQSQEQNIDNLVQAAGKQLVVLKIHEYDLTCQRAGRERAEGSQYISDNGVTEASGRGPGRFIRGVHHRGECQAVT